MEKPLLEGGIVPFKNNDDENLTSQMLEEVCNYYKIDISKPVSELSREELDIVLYGSKDKIHFKLRSSSGRKNETVDYYESFITNLTKKKKEKKK